jgi:hypothetical protein
MPQRSPEIVRNRVGECLQLTVCALKLAGARGDTLLEHFVHAPHLILGQSVLGHIAQVALNELASAGMEEIANGFDLDVQTIAVHHTQVLPAKDRVRSKLVEKGSIVAKKRVQGCDILRICRDEARPRKASQKAHGRVHIHDPARVEIQHKNSVLRCLKKPAVGYLWFLGWRQWHIPQDFLGAIFSDWR